MEQRYELKLADGKTAEWSGKTGEDAALPERIHIAPATVVATRLASSEVYGIWPLGASRIIE